MTARRQVDSTPGDGTAREGAQMSHTSPGMTLVGFRCVRRDHAEVTPRRTLTVHDGKWAFCGHEGPSHTHEWVPVAGMALRDLMLLG